MPCQCMHGHIETVTFETEGRWAGVLAMSSVCFVTLCHPAILTTASSLLYTWYNREDKNLSKFSFFPRMCFCCILFCCALWLIYIFVCWRFKLCCVYHSIEMAMSGDNGPYAKHKNAPPTSSIKVYHCWKYQRVMALLLLRDTCWRRVTIVLWLIASWGLLNDCDEQFPEITRQMHALTRTDHTFITLFFINDAGGGMSQCYMWHPNTFHSLSPIFPVIDFTYDVN